jgi:polyketide synthase 12/epothilone polyketide synthase D
VDLLARLATAGPEARTELLEGYLRTQLSQVLRSPEGKLEVDMPLTSLGMDSLMGLELRNRVEAALGVAAPAALAWTYPTLAAMASWLDGALAARDGSAVVDAAKPAHRTFVHALCYRPVAKPRVRLFCFHGGGASPEVFRAWSENPAWSDVEIIAMWHDRGLAAEDAPGKRYVEEAASLVQLLDDTPFAFVGKCLGVQFALGTTLELASRADARAPVANFLLGGSLLLGSALLARWHFTPEAEADMIARFFFENVPGYLLPTQQIRSDARMDLAITQAMGLFPEDASAPLPRVGVPLVAIAGSEDVLVPPCDVEACAARTTSDFRMHVLPGNHEFLVERRAEIMQIVDTHLERLLGGPV